MIVCLQRKKKSIKVKTKWQSQSVKIQHTVLTRKINPRLLMEKNMNSNVMR